MKKIILLLITASALLCCDKDDTLTAVTDPEVIAEFRPNLSELNLFVGNLNELNSTSLAFDYTLNTPLFSDYSHKKRIIVLPENTAMEYNGDGLPLFPDNTLIAKTFYYNLDERDLSLGKQIIETRLLIKINGLWETGNYKWNEDQTDATLDLTPDTIDVSWIDINGQNNSINYKIPSDNQCFTCHRTNQEKRPIGLKLRSLDLNNNGINQIQDLINRQLLIGVSDISDINALPKWDDINNYSLEQRTRAYLDMNCAHCHSEGGYCETQSPLRLNYETNFLDSNIQTQKNSIIFRVSSDFQPGLTMHWIGTSILHDDGVDLILEYLSTL